MKGSSVLLNRTKLEVCGQMRIGGVLIDRFDGHNERLHLARQYFDESGSRDSRCRPEHLKPEQSKVSSEWFSQA